MPIADEMKERLSAAFALTSMEILDESEQHRGHAGYQDGGESHFRLRLSAPEFAEMSRLARHRAIHAALGADLIGRIHALAIEISD